MRGYGESVGQARRDDAVLGQAACLDHDAAAQPGAGRAQRDELYAEAKRRDIRGRSAMSKAQLRQALAR